MISSVSFGKEKFHNKLSFGKDNIFYRGKGNRYYICKLKCSLMIYFIALKQGFNGTCYFPNLGWPW